MIDWLLCVYLFTFLDRLLYNKLWLLVVVPTSYSICLPFAFSIHSTKAANEPLFQPLFFILFFVRTYTLPYSTITIVNKLHALSIMIQQTQA